MIASAVTDLPQPDSPTSPTVCPGSTAKLTPSTAVIGSSPLRWKTTVMSSTFDRRVGQAHDQVHQHVHHRRRDDHHLQHGVVPALEPDREGLTHALVGEDPLGEHRSGQQRPGLQPDGRDDGQHRVAQHVPAADDPIGEPLGIGGTHVVLVEDVEHGAPGDPEDHRERDGRQRERGQDQVLERGPRRVPLSGQQPVEHEEARAPFIILADAARRRTSQGLVLQPGRPTRSGASTPHSAATTTRPTRPGGEAIVGTSAVPLSGTRNSTTNALGEHRLASTGQAVDRKVARTRASCGGAASTLSAFAHVAGCLSLRCRCLMG